MAPEDEVAVSGTGRGYDIDESARDFFVTGDESALPAISTVLPALPEDATVRVVVEVRSDDGRAPLPSHPRATVEWRVLPQGARAGDAMVDAVQEASFEDDTRVWAAGEAAAVQRIRKHLDGEVGLPRSQCVVRGYWKLGRASGGT
ncbi:MAG: siderophore-interacting protein [Acidimicrobiia bacterium]|nr:siderophore-interacting protein [Acidimicrobiia bacterium]